MASEVSICNRALGRDFEPGRTISSLTESSEAARQCNSDLRGHAGRGLCRWRPGTSLSGRALLALLKSAPGTPSNASSTATQWSADFPAPPWLYEYAYPDQCLQMRTIIQQLPNTYIGVPFTSNPSAGVYPYIIGPGAFFESATDLIDGTPTNVLLTNQYLAIGRYTAQITNPLLFGPQFVEALVQALAAKLAMALTGKVSLANMKFQQANAVIGIARAGDANEGLTVIDNMPDWITCREDGPYDYVGSSGYTAPYAPLYGLI
jgi:hypothetical protein